MTPPYASGLLPEEDAIDDPDDDVDLDLSLPGDLWFDVSERWRGHRILSYDQASGN